MLERVAKKQHGDDAHDDAAASKPRGGARVAASVGLPFFLGRSPESRRSARAEVDGDDRGRAAGGSAHGAPAPMSFPHAGRISGALQTRLPLKGVFDPEGCAARGTPAFTDGEVTHFAAESPALHVAAHEAAHQLQHSGVAHDFGLGAEGHASAVADSVAAGGPAAGLVGRTGARVASARRNYTEADAQGNPLEKGPARLSDTGETLTFRGQTAYATEALINQSNGILQARGSGVKISSGGGGPSVVAPLGGATRALSLVKVEIAGDKEGKTMPGDCREAAIEVMGATGEKSPETAVCNLAGQQAKFQKNEDIGPERDFIGLMNFIDKRVRETPDYASLSDAEKQKVRDKAKSDFYFDLMVKDREKLRRRPVSDERAKALGIDKYAAPRVGEAYGTLLVKPVGEGHDAMHWAGVIMAPGADRVTLENLGTGPGVRSKDWFINTYGTANKPDQSFYEQWLNTQERHTFVMQTKPQPPDYAGQLAALSTTDLCARHAKSADPDEKVYLDRELAKRTVDVEVRVDKQQEWFSDRVYVAVKGGGRAESKSKTLGEGESHVFSVPVNKLLPLGPSLTVSVFEWDVLPDDLIGSVSWAAPYAPISGATVSGDDASYTVSISMSGPSGGGAAAPPP